LDFTLKKYEDLCRAIKNSKSDSFTVKDYLSSKVKNNFIIMRHDVDRSPKNALKLAKIENKYNIKSTFYFRLKTFDKKIMNQIKNLGHEIGYHYESLDEAKGNFEKAKELFIKNLKKFKNFNIKTVCMHGNPLTKWTNKDMWEKYNLKKLGIIGEAYLSIDFNNLNYFSDTGRKWNSEKYSLKDKTESKLIKIKNTDMLINAIQNNKTKKAYILTHPCRWNDNIFYWTKELIIQNIKNKLKVVLRYLR